MPFKLQISHVEYRDAEVAISGRLVEGAYAGPEAVVLWGQDGRCITAAVTHHSLYSPEDWPVLSSHNTVLTLSIDSPDESFRIDESKPAIGRGTVFENSNRVDISHVLADRLFWAMQLSLSLQSDSVEEPYESYFGVSADEINSYYHDLLDARFHAGVWPYIRIAVCQKRYVELEYAASIEYQDRIWIGDSEIPRRVLLGYHSGHFSLPALRFEEVIWFDNALRGSPSIRPVVLLLMSGCNLEEPASRPLELAAQLFSQLPGVRPGVAESMARIFLDNLTVPEVRWERDSALGWINNWRYSQRNPKSTMSVLNTDDFGLIAKFFDKESV